MGLEMVEERMAGMERVKRVTDLFVEGRVVPLGSDEDGSPVLLWINKLNPFEDEECRRDGMAARSQRVLELNDPATDDYRSLHFHVDKLDKEALIENRINVHFDEDYVLAMDDVELDPAWSERMTYIKRMETLHEDAALAESDDRRQRYITAKEEYFNATREAALKRQEEHRREWSALSLAENKETYLEETIEKLGMQDYMAERRITELYYAIRDCKGVADADAEDGFNHKDCDHRKKFLESRAEVKELPPGLTAKLQEGLALVTVDRRSSGNLAALMSSSELSEQPNSPEESTVSIPVVTPPVAVST